MVSLLRVACFAAESPTRRPLYVHDEHVQAGLRRVDTVVFSERLDHLCMHAHSERQKHRRQTINKLVTERAVEANKKQIGWFRGWWVFDSDLRPRGVSSVFLCIIWFFNLQVNGLNRSCASVASQDMK